MSVDFPPLWERPERLKDHMMRILQCLQDDSWVWYQNAPCKYVEIRIDMRDGGHLLLDRSGSRVSIEEIERQRGKNFEVSLNNGEK